MNRIMGIVNLVNEFGLLGGLHRDRCIAAVPFGGRYRLIDFILSSMVNSGVSNVSVFAHHKYRAIRDHIGSGKDWDLDRKNGGLYLLPTMLDERNETVRGDLQQFYEQRDHYIRSRQEYVLIAGGHTICNIDFRDVLNAHLENKADITVIYNQTNNQPFSICRKLVTDDSGRVIEIQEHNSRRLTSDKMSLEMYLIHKKTLLDLVETTLAKGYDDFLRDVVMKNLDRLHVQGYDHIGYTGIINTLPSYYKHNMNMLQPDFRRELFSSGGPIYTKIKDEPPSRYGESSVVRNSLIANGCVIEGTVENSILFRGVKVNKGAVIRDSIILQHTEIGADASVINTILDKEVSVTHSTTLVGDPYSPYLVVKRGII